MEYQKFTSIKNICKMDIKGKVLEADAFITEKIDGANFTIIVDKGIVVYAKRTAILEYDEKFFKYMDAMKPLEDKFIKLYNYLGERTIHIRGELYGGWAGRISGERQSKKKNYIQKRIIYSKDIKFIAFDLQINEEYQYYEVYCDLYEKFHIPYLKALQVGKLKDMIKISPEFETTISDFPNIPDNLAEGFVVRLMKPINSEGGRLITKILNERFMEINHGKDYKMLTDPDYLKQKREAKRVTRKKQWVPKPVKLDEETKKLLSQYINYNRLCNVKSKLSEDERSNENLLIGKLVQDAYVSVKEDDICGNAKCIKNHLNNCAFLLIKGISP